MLREAFREALSSSENGGEVQQFALKEAWRLLRQAKVYDPKVPMTSGVGTIIVQVTDTSTPTKLSAPKPFRLPLSPEEQFVMLPNGQLIKNIPANLEVSFGETVRAWRVFRQLGSDDLAARTQFSKPTLSSIENARIQHPKDPTIIALSQGLDVPAGILVTRLRPQDFLQGESASTGSEESLNLPLIEVHFERTYGEILLAWRRFLGLKQVDMAKILGKKKAALSKLEIGKSSSPFDLDSLSLKLWRALNIPPGVFLTRSIPEEVIISDNSK